MIKYLFAILLFIASKLLFAQNQVPKTATNPTNKPTVEMVVQAIGKLSGRIIFTKNNRTEPVEFANVLAYRMKDSTLVSGALADGKGFFEIAKLQLGSMYYLQVQAIGFEKKRFGKYQVSMREPEIEVGDLTIQEATTSLKEVVVKGQKEDVEYQLDRKVYNIRQTMNSQGGTAVDALQNIPSVIVDSDGSIQLRGSGNILVLIDGKPSSITGNDRQAVLNQIPASLIESVEVITSPSAKYDAESSAGIINIITKKDKQGGLSGSASYTVGNRDKYNGSLNLNYRENKWAFSLNYDQIHDRRFTKRDAERNVFGKGTNTFLSEREYLDGFGDNHNIKFGIDYFLTKRQTISATTFLKFGSINAPVTNQSSLFDQNLKPIAFYAPNSTRVDKEATQDFTLGYKKTFAQSGKEWTIDLVYLQGNYQSDQDLSRQNFNSTFSVPTGNPFLSQNNITTQFYTFTAQTDYVKPIDKTGKLELGLKTTLRNNDADFQFNEFVNTENKYRNKPTLSNRFVFDEGVYAGYVNFSNQYKKLSYSIGLRGEFTKQTGNQKSVLKPSVRDSSYFLPFPSALLNYQLSEKQRLQFGFTRRINRPAYGVLNPFIFATNPQNLVQGNQNVKPEMVNSLELGHLAFTKKGSVNTTLFYRYTSGQVARIRTVVDSLRSKNVTVMTFDNIQDRTSYGLEFVAMQNITKAWRVSGNFSIFRTELDGLAQNVAISANFNAFTSRLVNAFRFGKDWEMQLIGTYRSPQQNAQGETKEIYYMDFGLKKEVFKGKGTLNFRVSDVFDTFQFDVDVRGTDFYMLNPLKRETKVAFLGLTYRFAQKIKATERRERKIINESRAGESEN